MIPPEWQAEIDELTAKIATMEQRVCHLRLSKKIVEQKTRIRHLESDNRQLLAEVRKLRGGLCDRLSEPGDEKGQA